MKNFVDTIIVSPIYANSNGSSKHDPFEMMTWDRLVIPNRSFAWSLYFDRKKYDFLLKPDREDVRWRYYFQKSGTIEYGLLDLNFVKDKLVMEKIKLLLAPDFYNKSGEYGPIFFLKDKENKQYISESPGAIGGHKKLKIYGRLDCPSANRYVAKGQYVRHRVFFDSVDTAVAAGFRPCGTCMPEAYKKWKEVNKK